MVSSGSLPWRRSAALSHEGPDAGRAFRVAGRRRRAGPVAQEGADILRVVLAALVSGAAGADPRA